MSYSSSYMGNRGSASYSGSTSGSASSAQGTTQSTGGLNSGMMDPFAIHQQQMEMHRRHMEMVNAQHHAHMHAAAFSPLGGMASGFGGMNPADIHRQNMLMHERAAEAQAERAVSGMANNSGGSNNGVYHFSSSTTYSSGDGVVRQSVTRAVRANGIEEVQHAATDNSSGQTHLIHGRGVDGRRIVKERIQQNGSDNPTDKTYYQHVDPSESEQFTDEWKQRARQALPGGLSGGIAMRSDPNGGYSISSTTGPGIAFSSSSSSGNHGPSSSSTSSSSNYSSSAPQQQSSNSYQTRRGSNTSAQQQSGVSIEEIDD